MDGAMGTEISRRGVSTTLLLWSAEALLTHPEVAQKIHEGSIAAGAEIVITDTFRTTERAFAKKISLMKRVLLLSLPVSLYDRLLCTLQNSVSHLLTCSLS